MIVVVGAGAAVLLNVPVTVSPSYLFKSALPPLNLIPVPFIFISPLLILASDYIIISLLTVPLIDEDLNISIIAQTRLYVNNLPPTTNGK